MGKYDKMGFFGGGWDGHSWKATNAFFGEIMAAAGFEVLYFDGTKEFANEGLLGGLDVVVKNITMADSPEMTQKQIDLLAHLQEQKLLTADQVEEQTAFVESGGNSSQKGYTWTHPQMNGYNAYILKGGKGVSIHGGGNDDGRGSLVLAGLNGSIWLRHSGASKPGWEPGIKVKIVNPDHQANEGVSDMEFRNIWSLDHELYATHGNAGSGPGDELYTCLTMEGMTVLAKVEYGPHEPEHLQGLNQPYVTINIVGDKGGSVATTMTGHSIGSYTSWNAPIDAARQTAQLILFQADAKPEQIRDAIDALPEIIERYRPKDIAEADSRTLPPQFANFMK